MAKKCDHKGCGNTIKSEAAMRFCYLHEHEQLAITPKGQYGFRNTTGSASWQSRLRKEQALAIPDTTAGIKGFPFFTVDDLENHVKYIRGDDNYKPTAENVLDRYPIQSIILKGYDVSGDEIAVIDGDGKMHIFDHNTQPDIVDGMRGFSVDNGDGTIGIADDEKYQVIVVDDDAIADRYGLSLEAAV